MGDIDDRLRELLDRRRELPGSIAVMETHAQAAAINRHVCELENLTMRLATCWDGEFDQIGAFSQTSYLHALGWSSAPCSTMKCRVSSELGKQPAA